MSSMGRTKNEGIQIGIEQGIEQGREVTLDASRLLMCKTPYDSISEKTGFTIEEIKEIEYLLPITD